MDIDRFLLQDCECLSLDGTYGKTPVEALLPCSLPHPLVSSPLPFLSVQMQGQWWYNGAGYSHIVGCPISMFMSTMAFMGLGGLYSQPGR